MGLRDLKLRGHFALPGSGGAWERYDPGDLARCPAPTCRRGFMQAARSTIILVRSAPEGIGSDDYPSGFEICQDTRCKTRREVRIVPAGKESDRLEDQSAAHTSPG